MPHAVPTTAIIGAGIAGLACARALQAADLPVRVFDKGRGPGGRMASRHRGDAAVDLGAQFFSVRDERFRREVAAWQEAGRVAPWPERQWRVTGEGWRRHRDDLDRLTGVPRMSALPRHLAQGLDLRLEARITRLERDAEGRWVLAEDDTRHGPFDRVVLALPSSQAAALLAPVDAELAAACEAVIQRPCWAAWARFTDPLPRLPGVDADWPAVRLDIPGPLRFVARNDHKPGRSGQGESLSLLARLEWSQDHLEAAPDDVADALLAAFREALPAGIALPEPHDLGAHRWRYAQPDVFAAGEAVNRDYRRSASGLSLCGDGWRGPRIEDAWLSGHHLGEALTEGALAT